MQETSTAALDSLEDKIPNIERQVFEYIKSRGRKGSTCDEAEIALGLRHQTCSARFTALSKRDEIIDSGERRPTRSGRKAIAWITVEQKPPEQRSLFDE
jgi:hypothetical protein